MPCNVSNTGQEPREEADELVQEGRGREGSVGLTVSALARGTRGDCCCTSYAAVMINECEDGSLSELATSENHMNSTKL